MVASEHQRALEEQIGRARACIAASRRSIVRSRERIDDSLRVVTHGAGRFILPEKVVSEQHYLRALEYGAEAVEQRQINREVRTTVQLFAGEP